MELAAAGGRLAQFVGAAILFGWPLFHIYSPLRTPSRPSLRTVAVGAALLILAGAAVSLATQTATMMGEPAAAFDPDALRLVLTATVFGSGLAARIGLCVAAIALAMAVGARGRAVSTTAVGTVLLASFLWTGHAAGGEGVGAWVHRGSDLVHLLAAGAWLGALGPLALRLHGAARTPTPQAAQEALRALERFSGLGPVIVGVLVASGLVNSWRLVGYAAAWRLNETAYGQVLLIKLGLFALMLGLAAANRWLLTPKLAASGEPSDALRALRLSLLVETALGLLVLVAVSVLGLLPPPSETG